MAEPKRTLSGPSRLKKLFRFLTGSLVVLVLGLFASMIEVGRFIEDLFAPPLAASFSSDQKRGFEAAARSRYLNDGRLDEGERKELAKIGQDLGVAKEHVLYVLEEFETRLRLAGESLERGLASLERGAHQQARVELESAARSDPDDPRAWSNLGAIEALMGRHEEARRAYDHALQLAPDDWGTRYNFGLWLARTGNAAEALPHLQQALASIRAQPAEQSPLEQVLQELRGSPALRELRAAPGFAALVNGG